MKVVLTTNALDIIAQFETATDNIQSQMRLAMFRALSILDSQIKQNLRVNSGLHVVTGTLLNSIQQEIITRGIDVIGKIGPENVPYAGIHEFGGSIPARIIKPRLKQALKWNGPNGPTFSKGHVMGPIYIKPRPYLRPAAEQHAERIAETFAVFLTEKFETP